jgi:alpha-1,2-mannosyltransferase
MTYRCLVVLKFSDLSAVVEMMAAGLVTLAHRSGGPLMDIVVEEESSRNGFLASHDQVQLQLLLLLLSHHMF